MSMAPLRGNLATRAEQCNIRMRIAVSIVALFHRFSASCLGYYAPMVST